MRNPTGLSWEEHTALGEQLRRFRRNLNQPPLNAKTNKINGQIHTVLKKLFYELDEFVYKDFPDRDHNEKCDVYYGWRERSAPLCYADAVDMLFTLRDNLMKTNPKSLAIKYIDTIVKLIDENGLRHIPAPTELPPST